MRVLTAMVLLATLSTPGYAKGACFTDSLSAAAFQTHACEPAVAVGVPDVLVRTTNRDLFDHKELTFSGKFALGKNANKKIIGSSITIWQDDYNPANLGGLPSFVTLGKPQNLILVPSGMPGNREMKPHGYQLTFRIPF